jgi:hypothetical protein
VTRRSREAADFVEGHLDSRLYKGYDSSRASGVPVTGILSPGWEVVQHQLRLRDRTGTQALGNPARLAAALFVLSAADSFQPLIISSDSLVVPPHLHLLPHLLSSESIDLASQRRDEWHWHFSPVSSWDVCSCRRWRC